MSGAFVTPWRAANQLATVPTNEDDLGADRISGGCEQNVACCKVCGAKSRSDAHVRADWAALHSAESGLPTFWRAAKQMDAYVRGRPDSMVGRDAFLVEASLRLAARGSPREFYVAEGSGRSRPMPLTSALLALLEDVGRDVRSAAASDGLGSQAHGDLVQSRLIGKLRTSLEGLHAAIPNGQVLGNIVNLLRAPPIGRRDWSHPPRSEDVASEMAKLVGLSIPDSQQALMLWGDINFNDRISEVLCAQPYMDCKQTVMCTLMSAGLGVCKSFPVDRWRGGVRWGCGCMQDWDPLPDDEPEPDTWPPPVPPPFVPRGRFPEPEGPPGVPVGPDGVPVPYGPPAPWPTPGRVPGPRPVTWPPPPPPPPPDTKWLEDLIRKIRGWLEDLPWWVKLLGAVAVAALIVTTFPQAIPALPAILAALGLAGDDRVDA